MTKTSYFAFAALLLCGNIAARAEPAPKADTGTTIQANCIDENDRYVMRGKTPTFVITFENKCEQHITCRVFAFVTSARGMSQGRGTIVLAAKSRGVAAKGTYAMKVKMIGGNSMSDRECKVF
jgi:hypothetical protein